MTIMHHPRTNITGHSDVVMGVICMNSEAINKKMKFLQNGEIKCVASR